LFFENPQNDKRRKKLKTLKLQNSKIKNAQYSQEQNTSTPLPPFHTQKKNEDPQNDKKKTEDPQTFFFKKSLKVHKMIIFLKQISQ
jgi:hypothetical protein